MSDPPDRGIRQGLFPLPVITEASLHDGSVFAAPDLCRRCPTHQCTGDALASVLICPFGINFFRFDGQLTICGFFLERHHPKHPTPRDAQSRFTSARMAARKAREAGRPSVFLYDHEWKSLSAVLARWSTETATARTATERAELLQVLGDDRDAERLRQHLRGSMAGLNSAIRHDISQLATAINSAIENVLDLKYGDVARAIGWDLPQGSASPAPETLRREIWQREKAIFFFSELLNLRLALSDGVPEEKALQQRVLLSPHGMFLKIIEPYRLLAQDRKVKISVSGSADGKTLAPYEPFLVPALAVIDNAVKYAPDNSEVSVRFSESSREIGVDVDSYGPKIEPNECREIFAAGIRGKAARSKHEGQGLGLWLARTLLRQWGGDITASQLPAADARSGLFLTTFSLRFERR